MGRIGQAVARRARGFDMEIHYHNRRRLPADEEMGAIYHADADDLLSVADFLSIHSPATPETHHWLNAERIARLPDRAVVINTARGSVVDDEALIAALRPASWRRLVWTCSRTNPGFIRVTRHCRTPSCCRTLAAPPTETRDAMGFMALDNLDAFFAGREVPNRVV